MVREDDAPRRRLGMLGAQLAPHPGRPSMPPSPTRSGANAQGSGPTLVATVPLVAAPEWAVLERQLMRQMEEAVHPYLAKYTHPDGRLVYEPGLRGEPDLELDPEGKVTASRDGLDDFYESFYNWPLLYLLGGGDELLELGQRQFDATTRLGEEMGARHSATTPPHPTPPATHSRSALLRPSAHHSPPRPGHPLLVCVAPYRRTWSNDQLVPPTAQATWSTSTRSGTISSTSRSR